MKTYWYITAFQWIFCGILSMDSKTNTALHWSGWLIFLVRFAAPILMTVGGVTYQLAMYFHRRRCVICKGIV